MDYPALVEEHFEHPRHAGTPPGRGSLYRGEAGSRSQGAQVLVETRIRDAVIVAAGFQAWGCPWTIAACSLTMEELQGASVSRLKAFDPQLLAKALGLPAERLGRLLILQDALRNCWADWDTSGSTGEGRPA